MTDQKYKPFTKEELAQFKEQLWMKARFERDFTISLADGGHEHVDFEVMGRFLATIDAAQRRVRSEMKKRLKTRYEHEMQLLDENDDSDKCIDYAGGLSEALDIVKGVQTKPPPCQKCGYNTIDRTDGFWCPTCGEATPRTESVEHIPTVFCDSPPCSNCGTVTISEDTLWRCPDCGGTEAKGGG
jgi:rubrerythrin